MQEEKNIEKENPNSTAQKKKLKSSKTVQPTDLKFYTTYYDVINEV